MPRDGRKEPLYRKVNTRARGVRHRTGGDYRHERHTKAAVAGTNRGTMHGAHRRGLDYTPLFRFLLSKVGSPWDAVYSEAVARLDQPEPIFWLVARTELERQAVVHMGESTHYTGLYVDDDGVLRVVDPDLRPEHLTPYCACCTHTLNGVPFSRSARPPDRGGGPAA